MYIRVTPVLTKSTVTNEVHDNEGVCRLQTAHDIRLFHQLAFASYLFRGLKYVPLSREAEAMSGVDPPHTADAALAGAPPPW